MEGGENERTAEVRERHRTQIIVGFGDWRSRVKSMYKGIKLILRGEGAVETQG